MSVVFLALYINSVAASKLYKHPQILWLVCPLLFIWIRRILLLTDQGLMADDPVIFAFKDLASLIIAVVTVVFGVVAMGF